MGKLRIAVFFIIITSSFYGQLVAQTLSNYSALGIGDLYLPAEAHHQGMGGVGISNSNVFFQGSMNPALLPDNGVYSFAAGFSAVNKTIFQNDDREKASGGTLNYLNMILPIIQGKIAMSIGLMPYSNVNYNFRTEVAVDGNPDASLLLFNKGTGGFNQFAFSTGVKLTRGLYLGGKVSYIFSSINRERNNYLSEPIATYVPTTVTKVSANDFIFGIGLDYKYYISENLSLSIGGIFDFARDLSVIRDQTLQINTTGNIPIRVDTLYENERGYLHLPESYGLGFSISKLNRWTFGTDLRFQRWGDFKDFDGNNENLRDVRLIRVGAEITPDATSVDNYFSRITYRFGLNIDQLPYFLQDTQINEFGINFGMSLPVSNFSSVDLGFRYGSRGTINNNLIREDYFRIYFGITFNDNRWFVRPKFN